MPLKAGHEKCGAQINYKSTFPIMREISVLGQSHNHGDDANFDFVRQYYDNLVNKTKKNKIKRKNNKEICRTIILCHNEGKFIIYVRNYIGYIFRSTLFLTPSE